MIDQFMFFSNIHVYILLVMTNCEARNQRSSHMLDSIKPKREEACAVKLVLELHGIVFIYLFFSFFIFVLGPPSEVILKYLKSL